MLYLNIMRSHPCPKFIRQVYVQGALKEHNEWGPFAQVVTLEVLPQKDTCHRGTILLFYWVGTLAPIGLMTIRVFSPPCHANGETLIFMEYMRAHECTSCPL